MSINEINLDVAELQHLLTVCKRHRVTELLENQKKQWEDDIKLLDVSTKDDAKGSDSKKEVIKTNIYHKQIDTYAWDQSAKFLKIYVNLPGVQSISKDKVTCDFKERSFQLVVAELNYYTYTTKVSKLLHPIDTSNSFLKIKSDSVLVMLKKWKEGQTWEHVTERENKAKERKKPELDKDADPQESLMGLLQNMYEEGDDEMKRTIKKAFYESRMKKSPDTMDDL